MPDDEMVKIEALADFMTECHRRIAAIHDDTSYRQTYMWVTGAPEWSDIPEWSVDDLSHHLEAKRQDVVRKAMPGALAG